MITLVTKVDDSSPLTFVKYTSDTNIDKKDFLWLFLIYNAQIGKT